MTFNCGLKQPDKNEWREVDDYLIVKITQDQVMYIDKADKFLIENFVWSANKNGDLYYVKTNIDNKTVKLHRLLLNPDKNLVVDHLDDNGLNNRRSNLRIVTQQINARNMKINKCNTTGYKGIYYEKKYHRWKVHIYNKNKVESKSYSISKYGEEAKEMAIEWSQTKEKEYSYLNTH